MNIVCLRGLVREAAHWGAFLKKLEGGIPGASIISLELAGNGERYKEESPLDLSLAVEDLRKRFLRQRGQGPSLLFALSLGGMIAAEWMKRYPEDFAGIVLVNSSFRNFNSLLERLRWRNYPKIMRTLLSLSMKSREKNILALVSNRHGDDEKVLAAWIDIQTKHPVSKANALRQLRSANRFRAPDVNPSGAPVLVLTSEGDKLVDHRCSLQIAARWNTSLKIHKTAGHDLPLDEPDWVIKELRSWIEAKLKV